MSLNAAKRATLALQAEQLTIGDFYAAWIKCFTETKKINSLVSNNLCKSMEHRQKLLFSNEVFVLG